MVETETKVNWTLFIVTKLTSRKFVLATSVLVAAMLTAVLPEYEDDIMRIVGRGAAILLAVGALALYLRAEMKVDVARAETATAEADARAAESEARSSSIEAVLGGTGKVPVEDLLKYTGIGNDA